MLNAPPLLQDVALQRQEFPGITNQAYFNFGGQGTLPRPALEAISDAYEFLQRKGPFSQQVNAWLLQKTAELKREIGRQLGVAPATLTLTENVTAGCNIVLWGIDWQAGDRLLMTDCEHPGVVAIAQEISRRWGVEITICPLQATLNQGDPAATIAKHLTPKTRLVILSHLLWNTGQVLPLADIVQICHHYPDSDRPIQVLVDGAQSVGSLPLNLAELQADYYAFTGHKWLCGPAGVGGLYIHPEAFASLQPTFIGWRGIDLNAQGQPISWKKDGSRFEVATSAFPLYAGLQAAIAFHEQWGNSRQRYQQICQLSGYLWHSLSAIEGIRCLKDSPPAAGLVSFQVPRSISHQELVKELEKQGFLLRTLANPDCIRACTHYFTLPAEIDQLVGAIGAILPTCP
jgi:L-cysteine/cystine lyase